MKLKRIMIVCISIVMVLGMIPLSGIVAFSEETENYGLLPDVEDRITTEATINNTRSGPSLPGSWAREGIGRGRQTGRAA